MRIEQARKHLGKKIKIVLFAGHNYSGIVQSVDTDHLVMRDKFDEEVMIFFSSVSAVTHVSDNPKPYEGVHRNWK